MSSPSTKTLDHIVHLTSPGSFHDTAEQFRQLGFKSVRSLLSIFSPLMLPIRVIDGGTHASGLTANSLIVRPSFLPFYPLLLLPNPFFDPEIPRLCPMVHI